MELMDKEGVSREIEIIMEGEKTEINEEIKKEEQNLRSSIRTYEKDASDALKNQNSSLGSIFIAEQKKREIFETKEEKRDYKKWFYIAGGIILLVLALSAVVYAIFKVFPKEDDNISNSPILTNKIVVANKEINIDTTNLSSVEIQKELQKIGINSKEALGEVLVINLVASTTESIKASELITKLSWRMPKSLTRVLENDYAFGIHSFENNTPFIVFKVSSYEQAFGGMFLWERDMVSDLSIFFDIPEKDSVVLGASTSTPPNTSEAFVDRVVKNKDTRMIVRDGNPILLYSFVDRCTLIITTNENTFKEIMTHLSAGRF